MWPAFGSRISGPLYGSSLFRLLRWSRMGGGERAEACRLRQSWQGAYRYLGRECP
jgi:hypothetical protein